MVISLFLGPRDTVNSQDALPADPLGQDVPRDPQLLAPLGAAQPQAVPEV